MDVVTEIAVKRRLDKDLVITVAKECPAEAQTTLRLTFAGKIILVTQISGITFYRGDFRIGIPEFSPASCFSYSERCVSDIISDVLSL